MISVRLEKLNFIVDEIRLAFHLAMHVTDPFMARTLTRHILVRTENFIEHARGLRKPLIQAGFDARSFHKTKESYATEFEEYFKVARHRLGAHVQDFDFGKRIELWNDIEIVKISFFVDGAEEIYRNLASLNIPGYLPLTNPPELTDSSLVEALRQYQRAADSRNWTEVGTDPLAMTRNNAVAVLNTTPVHARAGQLALIRRWVAFQSDLLERLADYPRIARILKARIITDLVSFCDCLVTRPVSPGAPQMMDGLDKLITASGQSSAPIDNFVATSKFQTRLQSARAIRDTIGAHLEIGDAHTVSSLIADLDAYDFQQALSFYGRISATFTKTCNSIIFLRMYAADGQRIFGVSASRTPAVPYAGNNVTAPRLPPDPLAIDDEEAYRENLTRWLDGDGTQRDEARHFFWGAFAGSLTVETIEEVETLPSGYRRSSHEVRKAHQFISSTLSSELSDSDFAGVLGLMLACRNGWPYPLAELLVRHGHSTSLSRQWRICHALGEIGSAPHASVEGFLKAQAHSKSSPVRLEAALALFKTFVKTEGLFRTNNRGQTGADYDTLAESLIASMTESERLVCLLAFASILSSPGIGSLSRPFESNYGALQVKIEMLCIPFLKGDENLTATLKKLVQTSDYVGICLLVTLEIDGRDQSPLGAALIDSCCNGSIATAGHDQASRHLAMCFLLKKEHRTAFEITEGLASRNPDWLEMQILVAEILGETLGAEDDAARWIADLRQNYALASEFETRLAAIETEMTKRMPVGAP
ncbi:hypothetical protein [Neorhizobium sp. T7_12]|uniref:hypothetical protein n=1 Tax=Neorhizobium sp. T7_12 TaxID=2093832 RepID=UPI000CF91821|nr:hypothetical protein [Neorhizobium sp. T7_12]